MYPVMLDVRGRSCLVVGGGGVALRKVDGLLREGARVTVVARQPIAALKDLAEAGAIQLEERAYGSGEAREYFLVFGATDDRSVNREVSGDAEGAGIWANVADDPELCTFHLPARLERGTLQLAIASGGEAPFVVRRLRRLLEGRFGPEWGEWIEAAGRFRGAVRSSGLPATEAEERFDAFFRGTVDRQTWAARVPSQEELEQWLGTTPAAQETTEFGAGVIPSAPEPGPSSAGVHERPLRVGLVSLVGAGPGDAGLLTLRGRARLLAADAVVYDRLAAPALPCDLPSRVELHCVGKQAGHHPVPQGEINALLVRLARRHRRVVRLKGGDPFVFGRGGEEAEALVEEGIAFEVVPSVTAGLAAPAYAGIPVTHRNQAVRMTLVTAHEAQKSDGPQVRWDLLAADPHATIVGYMGVRQLDRAVHQLLGGGMDPETPAAMIERGTTAGQRVVRSTLAKFPDAVQEHGIRPPGLFVIGPTVPHAEHLDWFGTRPLCGERLVLSTGARSLVEELELAGAEIVEVPLPLTPAARVVMGALPLSGCVLAGSGEVDAFDDERDGEGWSEGMTTWCLDASAAARARELGWPEVQVLEAGSAAALVRALEGRPRPQVAAEGGTS